MSIPPESPIIWHKPTRTRAGWHAIKVTLHIIRRALLNALSGSRHWPRSDALAEAPMLTERRFRL